MVVVLKDTVDPYFILAGITKEGRRDEMLQCPECLEELETLETRETLLYWDGKAYRFSEPSEPNVYCPGCGSHIGFDAEVKAVLEEAQ